jgi:hypothetical protein
MFARIVRFFTKSPAPIVDGGKLKVTPAEIFTQLVRRARNVLPGDLSVSNFQRSNSGKRSNSDRIGLLSQLGQEVGGLAVTSDLSTDRTVIVPMGDGRTVLLSQAYAHETKYIRAIFADIAEDQIVNVILNPAISADAKLLEELYVVAQATPVNEENSTYEIRREAAVELDTLLTSRTSLAQKIVGWGALAATITTYGLLWSAAVSLAYTVLTALFGGFLGFFIYVFGLLWLFGSTRLVHTVIKSMLSVTNWVLAIFWPAHDVKGGFPLFVAGLKSTVAGAGQLVRRGAHWVARQFKSLTAPTTITINPAAA